MVDEHEVNKIIKSLKPHSLSVDKDGRILIKDEEAVKKLAALKATGPVTRDHDTNYINCNC